jgi:hypothetical protein
MEQGLGQFLDREEGTITMKKNDTAKYTKEDLIKDRKELGYPRVVTAYAEPAAGPGWRNTPLWVVMEDLDPQAKFGKRMYVDCIQPDEQSNEIRLLYGISHQVHGVMVNECEKIMAERQKNLTRAEKRNERKRGQL